MDKEPEPKKRRCESSVTNSAVDHGEEDTDVEVATLTPDGGPSGSGTNVSGWDYLTDLEALKEDMATMPISEQEKVRDFIQRATVNMPRSNVPSASLYSGTQISRLGTGAECQRLISQSRIPAEELEKVMRDFQNSLDETPKAEKKNPFENDLIVKHFLDFLPIEQLCTCRLVCKNWNTNAVSLLRMNHTARRIPENGLGKFCKDLEGSTAFPFSNFVFEKIELYDNIEWNTFFTKFGSHLKTLQICEEMATTVPDDHVSILEYREKLKIVFRTVSQLEALTLRHIPQAIVCQPFVLNRDEVNNCLLPNMKSLVLRFYPDLSHEFLKGLFGVLPALKSLELAYWNPKAEFCTQLQTRKLEYIILDRLNDVEVSLFEQFLQSQSATLKVLYLMSGRTTRPLIQLPVLRRLTTFQFDEFMHRDDQRLFPFEVIRPKDLPSLKTIMICLDCINIGFANSVFTSVEELRIDETDFNENHAVTLSRLGSMFPNIKKLSTEHTMLRYDALGAIFYNFRNLKELKLRIYAKHLGRNINNALNGYPEGVELLRPQLIVPGISQLNFLPGHSVRDMKNLTKLVLRLNSEGASDFVIDDTGVHLGLLRMRPLTQLSLYGAFSISNELAGSLSEYHSNVRIVTGEPDD